ncbi:MAG: cytochrome C oxidase subunit IV family protein [Bacteroidia bacterium]|nr:cytochrome C oxidase subunit IV family protein [Bacteroidia bacterium]
MAQDLTLNHDAELAGAKQRRTIWIVFGILFLITAVEFVIAFTVDRGNTRNIIFIVMTLVKAFYIVGEFMHLKHEVKSLVYTIILPLVFVCWLILALLVEGSWYNGGWMRFLLG